MIKGSIILYMNQKKLPILYWFSSKINFSVEKKLVYSVVKCFNHEIKDLKVFNFIDIYIKERWLFINDIPHLRS